MSQIDDLKKPRSNTVQLFVNEDYSDVNKKLLNNKDQPKTPKFVKRIVAPDGGYGWVVVFASFLCNIIVDGTMFSFGLLLLEISKELETARGPTSWVGSLQTGFYLIAGPFVSFLANKYGCRVVAIIGAIGSAAAFAAASLLAKDLYWLCFTYGILGGIGYGFVYLPAIVIVGFYFDKKRAFATGIAVCGSGIGGFVLAPTVRLFINKHGWRKTVLFLAFLNLLCAIFSTFFKPLKEQLVEVVEDTLLPKDLNNNANNIRSIRDQIETKTYTVINSNRTNDTNQIETRQDVRRKRTSSMASPSNPPIPESFRQRSMSKKMSTSTISFAAAAFIKSDEQLNKGKLQNVDEQNSEQEIKSTEKKEKIFDLTLLKSPTFLLFSCAGFLTLFGFFIPFMYLVDRATQLGISADDGAMLLSIIGITNTIGRVICGWITDMPSVSPFLINNVALILGGAFTILLPIYFNTFPLLILYATVFGFSIACFAALRSIITIELLGLDRLTDAFGLLLLIQGIATMTGAPTAGWFYDQTQSYNASFYAAGTVILLSGLLCIPLPSVSRWEKAKLQRQTNAA